VYQAAEDPYLVQDHQLHILVIQEATILLPEVLLILQDMTEVLLLLTIEVKVLLTIDLLFQETIHAQLLRLITEAPAHHTTQDHLVDLTTTIHHLIALQVDQVQATQEEAVLVLRAEARVDPQEQVATPEVPEEEGGINSPLFFI
jgi:hypothetical protein